MAATVSINVYHGASGAETPTRLTDGQAVRFKQADNDTLDLNNKLAVPPSGSTYSYVKNFRFEAQTTPANAIDTLKVYSDGAGGFGTGVDMLAKTSATYVDPVANGTVLLAGTSTVFGYTAGSPLSVTGSIANPTTGLFGHYIVLQMSVTTTAEPGTTPSETITFSYDES